jgi:hypothetical protein
MTLRQSRKDPDLYQSGAGAWRYKGLWHYQWMWEFARRNPAYHAFHPVCRHVYDRISQNISRLEIKDNPSLVIWTIFSKTKVYQRLKNEFGLIYPENPKKHGRRIRGDIWAPEHFLDVIPGPPGEPVYGSPQTIVLSCDTRRPIDFILSEAEEILKQAGCRNRVTHIYPEHLRELLSLYDQYAALKKALNRKPKNYEVAQAYYVEAWLAFTAEYGSDPDSALNNEFAARYAQKIKKAKDYVEGKLYLDLARWRPYEEHFK